ncbi:hypothetical protein P7K49_011561 [Saguinus oedipus]|uniref:Uncharacterized protein n=1 Tax=Saguinus oedipus TaxID=9490 RepID=A0ABQ9VR04_SAGOE|nr:hypothetical protein P7K49_011561 [Saguinus oedipus]
MSSRDRDQDDRSFLNLFHLVHAQANFHKEYGWFTTAHERVKVQFSSLNYIDSKKLQDYFSKDIELLSWLEEGKCNSKHGLYQNEDRQLELDNEFNKGALCVRRKEHIRVEYNIPKQKSTGASASRALGRSAPSLPLSCSPAGSSRRSSRPLEQIDNVGQNDQAYDGKEHQDENIQHCGFLGRPGPWILVKREL